MHIRIINLHKWFPEDDPFAARMARLCILREDFHFELQEYVESESVPLKAEYDPASRRLYFFRRMCLTLRELWNACEDLSRSQEFKRFLGRQPKCLVKSWRGFKADLNRAMDTIIRPVRDAVSAHIKQSSIEQALNEMVGDAERSGTLQISFKRPAETHYKFAGELLTAVMLNGVAPADQEQEARNRADRFLPAVENLLNMIDTLFSAYAIERRLGG
jgi:hypothetical protein